MITGPCKIHLFDELVVALQWALDCRNVNKPPPDAWAAMARAALAKAKPTEKGADSYFKLDAKRRAAIAASMPGAVKRARSR